MSRRDAEAGAPAAARRARRRLAATLGPAGEGDGSDGWAGGAASAPGLLEHGTGPGGRPFRYDGGAQPSQASALPSDGGAHGPSRFRWRTGLRVAVLLGVLCLFLGCWFWWDVAASSPHVAPLSEFSSAAALGQPQESAGGSSAGGQASAKPSAAGIVVHVAGAVNRAGVVELPEGSRIHEAIAAAGGSAAGADLNRLNLAAVLADGQKIIVPLIGDPDVDASAPEDTAPADSGAGAGEAGPGGGKVDLNSASVEELGALPRVGPVLAQRIVDWRKEHGRFSTVEELDAVDGVGPKMLETLLPLVRVS
ncbi:ComEA family DNA-binding protein [Arthrobacter oryzae]|uniref:ComEA family DNA-binding protein n=1 Tax=Arthrobacter oryzae TaxID=409290 RepID=UPI00285D5357|nr:ComEA family DNA-binding protein [Arthrobacter oryzae]MDR6505836.1 competence protein ComEA [Arthrobacter oryzae]